MIVAKPTDWMVDGLHVACLEKSFHVGVLSKLEYYLVSVICHLHGVLVALLYPFVRRSDFEL